MNPTHYLRDTIDLIKEIETRFIELGGRLYRIHGGELWKGTHESYHDFLDSAKISKSNASMLEAVHKAFVLEGGVDPIQLTQVGYSNLYAAIPLIEANGVEKTVEMARILTRSEIKEEVRESKHGECAHTNTITICAGCHQRV